MQSLNWAKKKAAYLIALDKEYDSEVNSSDDEELGADVHRALKKRKKLAAMVDECVAENERVQSEIDKLSIQKQVLYHQSLGLLEELKNVTVPYRELDAERTQRSWQLVMDFLPTCTVQRMRTVCRQFRDYIDNEMVVKRVYCPGMKFDQCFGTVTRALLRAPAGSLKSIELGSANELDPPNYCMVTMSRQSDTFKQYRKLAAAIKERARVEPGCFDGVRRITLGLCQTAMQWCRMGSAFAQAMPNVEHFETGKDLCVATCPHQLRLLVTHNKEWMQKQNVFARLRTLCVAQCSCDPFLSVSLINTGLPRLESVFVHKLFRVRDSGSLNAVHRAFEAMRWPSQVHFKVEHCVEKYTKANLSMCMFVHPSIEELFFYSNGSNLARALHRLGFFCVTSGPMPLPSTCPVPGAEKHLREACQVLSHFKRSDAVVSEVRNFNPQGVTRQAIKDYMHANGCVMQKSGSVGFQVHQVKLPIGKMDLIRQRIAK